jgi:hypothetical protein
MTQTYVYKVIYSSEINGASGLPSRMFFSLLIPT